jgi:LuxR family maltose regulon positive regulatory protein
MHLVAAGEFDRAFDLVVAPAYELWLRGDIESVNALLDTFPLEVVQSNARRMLAYAHTLSLCARPDESRAWLDRARTLLAQASDACDADLATADALHLEAFTMDARDTDVLSCGARALERVAAGAETGLLGARLHEDLARAQLLAGDVDSAFATLTAAPDSAAPAQIIARLGVSARIVARKGMLDAAAEQARQSLAAASAFGMRDHVVTLDALLASCRISVDRNEIAAAANVLADVQEVVGRYPSFAYRVLVALQEVRIVAARDSVGAALEQLDSVRRLVAERECPLLLRHVDALEARMRLDAGQPGTAALLIARLPASSAWRRLLEVRLMFATGESGAARAALDAFEPANPRDQVEVQVLSVRASVVEGTDAEPTLRRLVDLAAPERFVRAVLDEGPVISRLVRRAAEASNGVEAERFATELGAPRRFRDTTGGEPIIPLSPRERDVLRFLPSRLTTREIASECLMSVNTVKAHLKKIYGKLGVTSRADAVERAYMLGDLSTRGASAG